MKKQIILKVHGRVQGVFFRDSTQQMAEELNLFGWVRNEPDGTVQIVAEGEEKDLKNLIEWCRSGGGKHSEIESIDVDWKESSNQFNNFTIK